MIVLEINPQDTDEIIKDTCRSAGKLGLFPEFENYLQDESKFDDQLETFRGFIGLESVEFVRAYDTDSKEQAFSIVRYPAYDVHMPGPGLVMMITISGAKDYALMRSVYKYLRKRCKDLNLKWYMDSRKTGEYRYENRYHII